MNSSSPALTTPSVAVVPSTPGDDAELRAEQRRRSVSTIAILCLLVLGAFYTLYFARDVFMPVVMAGILKMLLNPGVRGLSGVGIPYSVGSAIMVAVFLIVIGSICFVLAAPASEWMSRMPQWLPILQGKVKEVAIPLEHLLGALGQIERVMTSGSEAGGPAAISIGGSSLTQFLFTGTRSLVSLFATMILLLYFLLAAGDTFLRRLVEVLPRLTDKKRAVEMTRQIERDISTYLVTITVIYAGLGSLTGVGLWIVGMPDPLLWGVFVFVLAYVPYLGPVTAVTVLSVAALMSFDTVARALVVPGVYLILVSIEGQFLTPIVLSRRLTLNPVALFLSLLLWGFLWGVPGALLAVPMLATFKIVCDHLRPLAPIGHFLGE